MSQIKPLTLKRIAGDLKKFSKANLEYFKIYYDRENLLEINFLLKGREGTLYEGGEYIGKIVHSPDYPAKAPDYYIYTPNGRFHLEKKICLTNSGYHQSDWAPAAWNLVSLLEGFSSVWHSDIKSDKVGIGHIYTPNCEIIKMAKKSKEYNKQKLNDIYDKLQT